MAPKGKAEYVIEDVAGCGPFQIILLIVSMLLAKIAIAFSILFMSFGNYNPGWRCLDNVTSIANTSSSSSTSVQDPSSLEFALSSCDIYEHCQEVEFNPETSTVVTEWGLLCDKEWIPSLIISLQMVGMLIGSLVGGQMADSFGRKKIFYGSCAVCAVFQLLSSFSVSWIMLVVVRFVLGVFNACVLVVLYINIAEFMTVNWRAVLMGLPFWYVGSTIQALVAMGFKDWRSVELAGCIIFAVLIIPIFWAPESLRWLEVKGKTKEFEKVAKKIVKLNGKTLPSFEEFEMTGCYKENADGKSYTVLDMFRPGYRFITLGVAILNFSLSVIYYALSFGVKSLYGNFYINMILFNVIAMPFFLCAMVCMRLGNRIPSSLLFLGISIVCSLGAVGCLLSDSDGAKSTGSAVLISTAKGTIDAAWLVLFARITEIYPTVIRSTSLGFASLSARVGGIIAPFVIPNEKNQLYIFISISAVILVFACLVSFKLPETKGKVLKETFDDDENGKDAQMMQNDSGKEQET